MHSEEHLGGRRTSPFLTSISSIDARVVIHARALLTIPEDSAYSILETHRDWRLEHLPIILQQQGRSGDLVDALRDIVEEGGGVCRLFQI